MNAIRNLIAMCSVAVCTNFAAAQHAEVIVPGGPMFLHHSSTLQEGMLRGHADCVRAYGEAAEHQARAACEWETARAKYIANRRSVQSELRYEREAKKLARREANRNWIEVRSQIARTERERSRLPAAQLSSTGTMQWPLALQAAQFESSRSKFDTLLAARVQTVTTDERLAAAREAKQVLASMASTLEKEVHNIDSADWFAAKRFLKGLALEIDRPAYDANLAIAK